MGKDTKSRGHTKDSVKLIEIIERTQELFFLGVLIDMMHNEYFKAVSHSKNMGRCFGLDPKVPIVSGKALLFTEWQNYLHSVNFFSPTATLPMPHPMKF